VAFIAFATAASLPLEDGKDVDLLDCLFTQMEEASLL
jgi:hypothetical protein